MIKVENIEVYGIEHAIRGMRNPLNSWDKSDSGYSEGSYEVGEADMSLMRRLYQAGSDGNHAHRKYLRQICVWMDITAPRYWWAEFDTYKVGTTANSCSTMHKVHAKEFTLEDFSHEHLNSLSLIRLNDLIDTLNKARETYLKTNDKKDWWQMIQLLPSSYNQKRTLSFNYEVAFAMIKQRSGHKLDEWRKFVDILLDLPWVKEIRKEPGLEFVKSLEIFPKKS